MPSRFRLRVATLGAPSCPRTFVALLAAAFCAAPGRAQEPPPNPDHAPRKFSLSGFGTLGVVLQVTHSRHGKGSAGTLANVQPSFQPGGRVDVFSATLDFVF